MPVIKLETYFNASPDLVFDLSRSIDLHQISTKHTQEKAVGGRLSGLIELNESVIWQAKHFGIVQRLSSKITEFERPNYFVDEMVTGAFKSFRHEHIFSKYHQGTLMTDIFTYKSPLGILGRVADRLFLQRYITNLLNRRNLVIKDYAENDKNFFNK